MKSPVRRPLWFVIAAIAAVALAALGAVAAMSFTNNAPITIVDASTNGQPAAAIPYPSNIVVSGLTPSRVVIVSNVTVSLNGFSHDNPDDVDALVTSPAGHKVMIMSDAGDNWSASSLDLTFDDAAVNSLPDEGSLSTGSYKPSNYVGTIDPFCAGEPDESAVGMPAPAPAPPYGAALSVFNGDLPNGTWSLYVADDCFSASNGSIATGWTVNITTTTTAVGVTRFTGTATAGRVTLRWKTSQESSLVGFNVYRSAPGTAKAKLNRTLIRARHAGTASGGWYSLVDRDVQADSNYTYHLQVVNQDGTRSWYGVTSTRLLPQ